MSPISISTSPLPLAALSKDMPLTRVIASAIPPKLTISTKTRLASSAARNITTRMLPINIAKSATTRAKAAVCRL